MIRRLFLAAILASIPLAAEAQVIRKIEIVRRPVFEEGELPLGAARLFNSLHSMTRESVVRRDLLIREGDLCDSLLAAESARVLRLRPYLGDVSLDTLDAPGDSIDLIFTTRDLWTLEASLQPSGGDGAYNVDFSVSESNFRGRAQRFELGYNVSDRRSSGRIGFAEPAFFHPHVDASVVYAAHGQGNSFDLSFSHPLWAITVPWEYSASATRIRDDLLFYKDGEPAFAYPYTFRYGRVAATHAWGRRTRLTAGAALSWTEQEFGAQYTYSGVPTSLLAESSYFSIPDRTRVTPTLGVGIEHFHHPTRRFLDRFGRTEDLTTGVNISADVGKASPALGSSVSRELYTARFQAGVLRGPTFSNLYASLVYETDDGASEGGTQLQAVGHLYVKPALRHTLAFEILHAGWYRANRLGQMFLGALNGVRGFPARHDDGTRLWHANLEYRYFMPLRVLTVDVGSVVFTDVGQVWNRDEGLRIGDAEWTYGAGLRFGLSRSAGARIFRLDVARGPEGWVVSYGTEMYFTFDLRGSLRL